MTQVSGFKLWLNINKLMGGIDPGNIYERLFTM